MDVPASEVDRRFDALMSAEFATRSEARPFDLLAGRPDLTGLFEDEDDDWDDGAFLDDDYRSVDTTPHSWSLTVTIGFLLMAGGLLACLVMLFVASPGMPWPQVAAVVAVGGLAILLWKALHLERDLDGDGARV